MAQNKNSNPDVEKLIAAKETDTAFNPRPETIKSFNKMFGSTIETKAFLQKIGKSLDDKSLYPSVIAEISRAYESETHGFWDGPTSLLYDKPGLLKKAINASSIDQELKDKLLGKVKKSKKEKATEALNKKSKTKKDKEAAAIEALDLEI